MGEQEEAGDPEACPEKQPGEADPTPEAGEEESAQRRAVRCMP